MPNSDDLSSERHLAANETAAQFASMTESMEALPDQITSTLACSAVVEPWARVASPITSAQAITDRITSTLACSAVVEPWAQVASPITSVQTITDQIRSAFECADVTKAMTRFALDVASVQTLAGEITCSVAATMAQWASEFEAAQKRAEEIRSTFPLLANCSPVEPQYDCPPLEVVQSGERTIVRPEAKRRIGFKP